MKLEQAKKIKKEDRWVEKEVERKENHISKQENMNGDMKEENSVSTKVVWIYKKNGYYCDIIY